MNTCLFRMRWWGERAGIAIRCVTAFAACSFAVPSRAKKRQTTLNHSWLVLRVLRLWALDAIMKYSCVAKKTRQWTLASMILQTAGA